MAGKLDGDGSGFWRGRMVRVVLGSMKLFAAKFRSVAILFISRKAIEANWMYQSVQAPNDK